MSRTKYAAELCALIVEDIYGELSSRIATLLMRRGRLSIPSLVQHTHLTSRQLRHGLAVLIQQNLVFHHFDHDTQITFYEANHEAIYFLLRFGKIAEAIQSRYGDLARDIVQQLLMVGSTNIGDLVDSFEGKHHKHKQEQELNGHEPVNGVANGKTNGLHRHLESTFSRNRIEDALRQLSQGGFLELVDGNMFLSPDDIRNRVEKGLLQALYNGSIKGTKDKEELKTKVRERLQEIRSEHDHGLKSVVSHRPVNGDAKRRRLTVGDGITNGGYHVERDEGSWLDRTLIIRVNYEKCNVALRTERLIGLAQHDIGPVTSQVYGELLQLMEEGIPRCQLDQNIDDTEDTPDGPEISTMKLAQSLKKSLNIAQGIARQPNEEADITQSTSKLKASPQLKRKRRVSGSEFATQENATSDEIENDNDGDDDDDNIDENGNLTDIEQYSDTHGERSVKLPPRKLKVTFQADIASQENRQNKISQTIQHLLLLADHSKKLVRRSGGGGRGEWTVDFDNIIKYLKEFELDTFIVKSFGDQGSRIARILRQKGKLDEKQIQKFGLMKQKDIRTKLVQMQMAGFVDIQEVPRDNNRNPNRTIFLWYFDTERVIAIFLEKTFKTMSRAFQVLKAQKRAYGVVLALAERTDVRGQEEETLRETQLKQWARIRETEECILVQIGRLDELVALFRDF